MNYSTDTGELLIDGITMHCPAWNLLDLTDLWTNQSVRGINTVLPGASGRLANRIRPDEANHSLHFAVTGKYDRNGVAQADWWEGLEANLLYLEANVVLPPAATTRAGSLVMPSGATRTADVQVLPLEPLEHLKAELTHYLLHMRITSARFV